jgi:hypothetical protein
MEERLSFSANERDREACFIRNILFSIGSSVLYGPAATDSKMRESS